MEIKNIFKETVPAARLIGRRYTDDDRENGLFAHKWCEFFMNGWFNRLEQAGGIEEFDYLGMMRVVNGVFEYWIGMLFTPGADVPDGFDFVDFDAFDAAVFWIYGNPESVEIYGHDVHCKCLGLLPENGWTRKENGWWIERYNCPRFTEAGERGNVILDYYLAIV